MNIEVTRIEVLTGMRSGPDTVMLYTDFPNGCWTYKDKMVMEFKTVYGGGEAYVKKHFNIEPKVIDIG